MNRNGKLLTEVDTFRVLRRITLPELELKCKKLCQSVNFDEFTTKEAEQIWNNMFELHGWTWEEYCKSRGD